MESCTVNEQGADAKRYQARHFKLMHGSDVRQSKPNMFLSCSANMTRVLMHTNLCCATKERSQEAHLFMLESWVQNISDYFQ